MNILITHLKSIVDNNRKNEIPDNVTLNSLKEHLQFVILDFLYNNPKYSYLTMCGGTALRICYDLPRMSEDLDFQTSKTFPFEEFKKDITNHFQEKFNTKIDVSVKEQKAGTDVAKIKFDILEELGLVTKTSLITTLKIRFDVNKFEKADLFETEIISKVKDVYSFSIKTYPISTLMASKIAAVLTRVRRGIDGEISDCKPRDIFDLMWYMEKKVIPNLDYLKAAGLNFKNHMELFSKIKERVENIDDNLFQNDLATFFYRSDEYNLWFNNWKGRFRILINSYEMYEVTNLEWIRYGFDLSTENRNYFFVFSTRNQKTVKFTFSLSEYWFMYAKKPSGFKDENLNEKISKEDQDRMTEIDFEYIGTFYKKIQDYLKRNDNIVLQPEIKSKLIRYTADKLDTTTQILLDENLLGKVKLEDLL